MDRSEMVRGRLPFEGAAQRINREGGLYLSEQQQKGLAAGLFAGAVLVAAGVVFSLAQALRRHRL
jgi:hypothetical protein